MANNITSPPVYPDVDALLPGVIVRAATWDRIANLVNRAAGVQVGGTVINQSWPDDVCQVTGNVEVQVTPSGIPVPLVSPAHSRIELYIEAASSLGANVRVHSVEAADDANLAVPLGGAVTIVGPALLDIANDGSGGDVVEIYLQGDAVGSQVDLLGIWAVPVIVGTLADTEIVPFGRANGTAADRPLTAARGRQMIESLQAAIDRPRPMLAWGGIDNVDGAGVPHAPSHRIAGMARYHGAREGLDYTVALHTDATGLAGESLMVDGDEAFVVAADDAAKWNTYDDALTRQEGAFLANDGTLSFRVVELRTTEDEPPEDTDVIVAGIGVWGP